MGLPGALGEDAKTASEFGYPAGGKLSCLLINSHPLLVKSCSWLLLVRKPLGKEPQEVAVCLGKAKDTHHSQHLLQEGSQEDSGAARGLGRAVRHNWLPLERNMAHLATQKSQCDWPERWAGTKPLRALKVMGKTFNFILGGLRSHINIRSGRSWHPCDQIGVLKRSLVKLFLERIVRVP